jgi:signal-transduction protein with cAMP-binding, CBS, and nucleotidyltransferase domain
MAHVSDVAALSRLDAFPYRHRVSDVMTRPLATTPAQATLGAVAARLRDEQVSSLVVVDAGGCAAGIVTERDLTRAMAACGAAVVDQPVSAWASAPVISVPADAFVHVALGRIDRHRLRHLVVTDAGGRAVGMVTARELLALRSGHALALGDALDVAMTPADTAAALDQLPALSLALAREGVGALEIAAVIAGATRDATRRAAELAEAELAAEGRPAPARWAMLVLGSAGRGETLLAPDQDNAVVHDGDADDPAIDGWFAELGRRVADHLDRAGLPYCKGGVMAREQDWRGSLSAWRERVGRWTRRADGADLLNADIFFDCACAHGDAGLVEELRRDAVEAARQSPPFLLRLALALERPARPVGWFGRIKTVDGRIDLKWFGLLPIVAGFRTLALKHGVTATATSARAAALVAAGRLESSEAERLSAAQEVFADLILAQQRADRDAGLAPSSRVDPRRADRVGLDRLRRALATAALVPDLVRDGIRA